MYFDVDGVRKLLPKVKVHVEKLMKLHRSLEILDGIEIENEDGDRELDMTIAKLNMDYHKKMYLYHKYMAQLYAAGAIVKDLDIGLVDFYSKHEGRDILLCWMYGEEDIQFWHDEECGFQGRQSVDMLQKRTTV